MSIDVCKSLVKKMSFTITSQKLEIEELRACLQSFSDLYAKYLNENITGGGVNPDSEVTIRFAELRAADACLMWSHESAVSRVKEIQDG